MKKLTAVNWIKNKIEEYGDPEYLIIDWKEFDDLINQARKIEKEEIVKAYQQGTLDGYEPNYGNGEKYYNATYGIK